MKEQGKQHEQVGNWKLFDVLKHLAGWAVWRVEATENLLAKGVTDYSHLTDLDDFNSSIVTERAGYSWDQVVKEIIDADETWIRMLDRLSEDVIFGSNDFKGPVWDTLDQWVRIAYDHYTHHSNIVKTIR